MLKVAYHTLGCKVNQYETENIRKNLEELGFETVSFSSFADSYVINSCSVTSIADSKSRAFIRQAIKRNPDAYIVVTGCYANLDPQRIHAIEGVDLIASNEEKDTIAQRIATHFSLSSKTESGLEISRPRVRTRAVVKVQDGCDQFCSYCIIPYARNKKTSRKLFEVIDEINALADFGYKEIVLTGIRLGSYKSDNNKLSDLITELTKVDKISRIRLSSIEMWEIDDDLLNILKHPKLCRHLHIPLQSGCDEVLKAMNRPYTVDDYLNIIGKIRSSIPDIGLTTDIIAGFPGETDEQFEITCNNLKRIDFSRLHVFRYSSRPGTKAASMPNHIESDIKKQRADILMKIGKESAYKFASQFIGRNIEVLIERQNKDTGEFIGYTDNYIETHVKATFDDCPKHIKGEIINVRITDVNEDGFAFGCF